MKMVNAKWELPITEEDGELVLTFPDNMMDNMNWNPGDTLVWEEMADGSAFIYKKVENDNG